MKEPEDRACSSSLIAYSSVTTGEQFPCVSFGRVFVSSSASICEICGHLIPLDVSLHGEFIVRFTGPWIRFRVFRGSVGN